MIALYKDPSGEKIHGRIFAPSIATSLECSTTDRTGKEIAVLQKQIKRLEFHLRKKKVLILLLILFYFLLLQTGFVNFYFYSFTAG